MLEAAKSLLLILSAIFPIVDPIGGSPFFPALTGGIQFGGAKSTVVADRVRQFHAAGRLVFYGYVHPGFLWDFAAGGAGGGKWSWWRWGGRR